MDPDPDYFSKLVCCNTPWIERNHSSEQPLHCSFAGLGVFLGLRGGYIFSAITKVLKTMFHDGRRSLEENVSAPGTHMNL